MCASICWEGEYSAVLSVEAFTVSCMGAVAFVASFWLTMLLL
jgi:hypothetical protein